MGTYQRKSKPTKYQKDMLSNISMSKRQGQRLAAGGSLEGKPSDYANDATDEERRRRDARHALEDRRIAIELGIDREGR